MAVNNADQALAHARDEFDAACEVVHAAERDLEDGSPSAAEALNQVSVGVASVQAMVSLAAAGAASGAAPTVVVSGLALAVGPELVAAVGVTTALIGLSTLVLSRENGQDKVLDALDSLKPASNRLLEVVADAHLARETLKEAIRHEDEEALGPSSQLDLDSPVRGTDSERGRDPDEVDDQGQPVVSTPDPGTAPDPDEVDDQGQPVVSTPDPGTAPDPDEVDDQGQPVVSTPDPGTAPDPDEVDDQGQPVVSTPDPGTAPDPDEVDDQGQPVVSTPDPGTAPDPDEVDDQGQPVVSTPDPGTAPDPDEVDDQGQPVVSTPDPGTAPDPDEVDDVDGDEVELEDG